MRFIEAGLFYKLVASNEQCVRSVRICSVLHPWIRILFFTQNKDPFFFVFLLGSLVSLLLHYFTKESFKNSHMNICTVCPISSDPFYRVNYFISGSLLLGQIVSVFLEEFLIEKI